MNENSVARIREFNDAFSQNVCRGKMVSRRASPRCRKWLEHPHLRKVAEFNDFIPKTTLTASMIFSASSIAIAHFS